MLWLLVVYVLSLVLLIFASLYTIDDFTFETTDVRTLDNLRRAFTQRDVLDVVLRSVLVALAVTAVCLVIALPTAFYIAKVAKPWARRGLIVSCLLPLWAGYLVKGYAWKALLRPAGEGTRRRVPRNRCSGSRPASAWSPSS